MDTPLRVSMRRNFAWSFIGNVIFNGLQWLLLVAIAHIADKEIVGQYALLLAITAPVYMTGGLNLRVVRATDVHRRWVARQYSKVRQRLNLVCIAVAVAVGAALGLRNEDLAALAVLAVAKAVEASCLVTYGTYQLRERLDLVARSLILRAILGCGLFTAFLLWSGELWAACVGILAGWVLTRLVHDGPMARRLEHTDPSAAAQDGALGSSSGTGTKRSLVRRALPLGLDAGIASLATNAPRFAVEFLLGTTALGGFAPLAYGAQAVSMITGSLGNAILAPLAKYVTQRDARGFARLLGRLLLFAGSVSGVGTLLAILFGDPVVNLLFGESFVNQPVLITLMVSVGAVTVERSLNRGLQATHRFGLVLVSNSVVLATTVIALFILVPRFDLVGAAASGGIGFTAGGLLSLVFLVGEVKRLPTA